MPSLGPATSGLAPSCRPARCRWRALVAFVLFGALAAQGARAGAETDSGWPDLAALGRLEVVTVSKRPQPAWAAAAALAVVTGDDLRRSTATNLPEALRLAPGLDVAQIDARNWAISARGFNAQYSNKLLVLIDGRSVYTPLFGGVLWDAHDALLADLERIEVVRGPGAALWGANAMNGVINIVTKSARDTVGGLVQTSAGTDHSGLALRWGAAPDSRWAWRVSAKADSYSAANSETFGSRAGDAWRSAHVGARIEFTPDAAHTLTLQVNASAFDGDYTQYVPNRSLPTLETYDRTTGVSGNSLDALLRWVHRRADGGSNLVQAWSDHSWQRGAVASKRSTTTALDWQQSRVGPRHALTWGLGYQRSWDTVPDSPVLRLRPRHFAADLLAGFLQDEFAVVPEHFDVVAGVRIEYNDFSGFELQPSLRAVWRPGPPQTLWAGLSRAVRNPTRLESDGVVNVGVLPAGTFGAGTPPALIEWHGSPAFRSETLVAWEAGWRTQPDPRVTLDLAVFLHDYGQLQDLLPTAQVNPVNTAAGPALAWRWNYTNSLKGQSHGAELAATWQPSSALRITSGYTFTRIQETGPAGGLNEAYFEHSTPRHAGFVRASWTFAHGWELDASLRTATAVRAVEVDGYTALDLRVAWRPRAGWTLECIGRNLTDPSHPEFRDGLGTQVVGLRRAIQLRVALQF